MNQTTDTLLLVRPFDFRKNEETAVNNFFQGDPTGAGIASRAQAEFDGFVKLLKDHNINTLVVQDEGEFDTPDSVFPNNGISFHQHTAVLYPMFAENRRRERSLNLLDKLKRWGFTFDNVIDYTPYEQEGRFLEGTGSLILDRVNRIAYCSLSPRADAGIAHQFCIDFGYEPFIFEANQSVEGIRKPIYHTNVMMSVGTRFVAVCLDSIDNSYHRDRLIQRAKKTGKAVFEISEAQMMAFAGNILEVKSVSGDPYIVMSTQAYESFTSPQHQALNRWGKIIHGPLDTIETAGGGSARCMIAEVFY